MHQESTARPFHIEDVVAQSGVLDSPILPSIIIHHQLLIYMRACDPSHRVGWIGALLALMALGTAVAFVAVLSLVRADADLGLLLKGKHKPNAFRGKVVWITGASQVRGCIPMCYSQREADATATWKTGQLQPSERLML